MMLVKDLEHLWVVNAISYYNIYVAFVYAASQILNTVKPSDLAEGSLNWHG